MTPETFRAQTRNSRGGRRRFTHDQKRRAVEYAAEAMANGDTLDKVARDLGIDSNSIRKWRKSFEPERPEPITIVADSSYIVLGPGNLRVECRNAQAVARLFAAMRC
jgi:transposase-like protein